MKLGTGHALLRGALVLALVMTTMAAGASQVAADDSKQDRGALARVIVDTRSDGVDQPSGRQGVSSTSSSCTTTYHNITGVNGWGERLWRLEQNTYWCWDGTYVTYASRSTPTFTYGYGWRLVGIVSSSAYGVGTTEYRAFVQAHFYRCYWTPSGETCIDDVYPWIQSILRGNGTSGGSAGR